jgi:hypothetical protein
MLLSSTCINSLTKMLFMVWQCSRFHALKLNRSRLITLLQCQLHQDASFVRTNRCHDGIELLHARHLVSVMMSNTVLAAQRMPPCILLWFKQFYQDATPQQMQQGCCQKSSGVQRTQSRVRLKCCALRMEDSWNMSVVARTHLSPCIEGDLLLTTLHLHHHPPTSSAIERSLSARMFRTSPNIFQLIALSRHRLDAQIICRRQRRKETDSCSGSL